MKRESGFKVEVDRVEDGIAVLVMSDDETVRLKLPVKYLPQGTRDGDHLQVSFRADEKSREDQKARVNDLLKELTRGDESDKSDKGDKGDA